MHPINYPIRHGLIENWNSMERIWQRCLYDYLRVEPENHYVLLVSIAVTVRERGSFLRSHKHRSSRCRALRARSLADSSRFADRAATESAGKPRICR